MGVSVDAQLFRAAPSGTTPCVANRHSATRSLRATATIPIRRMLLRDNQNHARCDNQASLTPVNVVQRKLHPGIMMSGRQADVKPGPLGPRLWRLRA
jgi:hypothetical protein